jgi:hypothetical protein
MTLLKMNTVVIPNALNGSMVLAVRNRHPKARIICLEVFPFYVNHLEKNLGVETALIDMSEDLMLQLQSIGTLMKIDWESTTVLMNAPYQEIDEQSGDRKDQASNLWADFMYAFAELVPRMASVQPSSWLSPSADFKGKRYTRFADEWRKHFKTINVKECARHFPGVGSNFTYFTLDKTQEYPATKLITESGSIDFAFSTNPVLGYNNLTPEAIQQIQQHVHSEWRNNFGFSRQGYGCVDEKTQPYTATGQYPYFHTNKTTTPKAKKEAKAGSTAVSKKDTKKKKEPSYMSSVTRVAEHAGVKATFAYSDQPHKFQHRPKVLLSLSGEYRPVLDENGELGYTTMVMPIICRFRSEARAVYRKLTDPAIVNVMNCLKWSGFVNIEVLMSLICDDVRLRMVRKNSAHAQSQHGRLPRTYAKLGPNDFKVKFMQLEDRIALAILQESLDHRERDDAKINHKRRAKDRTDMTGEVFTPTELVIEMLETLPPASWLENENYLDPAMGNGQFLAAIAVAKAELGHKGWLEHIFGVDLMSDNVKETKARLLKIAVKYGYDQDVAWGIINDNIHHGNTLDPLAELEGQSEKSRMFMKENFYSEPEPVKASEEISIDELIEVNEFSNVFTVGS